MKKRYFEILFASLWHFFSVRCMSARKRSKNNTQEKNFQAIS
jgi:hypothetical protein